THGQQQIQDSARAVNSDRPVSIDHQQLITLDEGIQSARRAVVLQPQQSEYWHVLGAALERKRADSEALQAFRKAHDLAPNDPRTSFALGLSALRQDALDSSIAAFQAAVQADPKNATYHAHLGIAIRRTVARPDEPGDRRNPPPDARARLDRARDELERATQIEPTDARWNY